MPYRGYTVLPNSPISTRYIPPVGYGDHIYFINGDKVHRWKPDGNVWEIDYYTLSEAMPGGHIQLWKNYAFQCSDTGETIRALNLLTGAVVPIPTSPLQFNRTGVVMCVVDNWLLLGSGKINQQSTYTFYASWVRYNIATGQWLADVPDAPRATAWAASGGGVGRGYIFGGQYSRFEWDHSSTIIWEAATNTWIIDPASSSPSYSMSGPFGRQNHNCARIRKSDGSYLLYQGYGGYHHTYYEDTRTSYELWSQAADVGVWASLGNIDTSRRTDSTGGLPYIATCRGNLYYFGRTANNNNQADYLNADKWVDRFEAVLADQLYVTELSGIEDEADPDPTTIIDTTPITDEETDSETKRKYLNNPQRRLMLPHRGAFKVDDEKHRANIRQLEHWAGKLETSVTQVISDSASSSGSSGGSSSGGTATPGTTESGVVKDAVKMATVTSIDLVGLQTIDGVVGAEGDRVLVKDQGIAGNTNGIYVMTAGPWARATDMNTPSAAPSGTLVPVTHGVANKGFWMLDTLDPIVLGTDAITFTKIGPWGNVYSTPASVRLFIQAAEPTGMQKGDIWIKVQPGEDAI